MAASEKGLTAYVYRSAMGDCTNGGASSRVNNFTLVGVVRDRDARPQFRSELIEPLPRNSQIFRPTEDAPAAVLVQSNLRGASPHLVPLDAFLSGKWTMSGGNLADCSDGRWSDVVRSFLPQAKEAGVYVTSTVDIHDRIEN